MMRHYRNRVAGPEVELTALEETCVHCGRDLPIYQKDGRWVEGLETRFRLIYRDKKCSNSACPGPRPIVKATRDPRIVVPGRIYGTDVILHVGERHASDGVPLAQIARDLGARGLPLDQRHSCRLFRDYVALSNLVLDAEDARIKTLLRKQGGIVLMCDGVQFENRSAVLYLVWDAMSGTPLFGERKAKRGTEDLIPLLKRVRDLDVPVIGVVTDKETGLVPAIKSVFPDVPYQYCQQHFLNNCAKPLKPDLVALQASIDRRAEGVARIAKRLVMVSAGGNDVASAAGQQSGPVASTVAALSEPGAAPQLPPAASTITPMGEPAASQQFIPSEPTLLPMSEPEVGNQPLGPAGVPVPPADEHEVVTAFCELVRANSRVSGKAPFDPAELKRHERLEQIRETVHKVKKTPRVGDF